MRPATTTNNGVRLVYRTHASKRGRTYRRRIKQRRDSTGNWSAA